MSNAPCITQHAHLTETELDDHLIGDLAAAAATHLAACPHCTGRLAAAAAPLSNFRDISLAWGQRHSAAAPQPVLANVSNPWERRFAYSLAIAAAALGLSLVNTARRTEPTPTLQANYTDQAFIEQAGTEQAKTPTPDQLSDDNRLLNTIDREISSSNENSATLGLMPISSPRPAETHAASTRTSIQD